MSGHEDTVNGLDTGEGNLQTRRELKIRLRQTALGGGRREKRDIQWVGRDAKGEVGTGRGPRWRGGGGEGGGGDRVAASCREMSMDEVPVLLFFPGGGTANE